jgi:hypothetical protein
MIKQKSKRRFAQIEYEILYSKAWEMLSHAQRVIYLHLKGEFRGINENELRLPYLLKMKRIVKNKNCFYSGMRRLEELGFIDCVSFGQKTKFINGCLKTPASIYKLSGRWRIYGKSIDQYTSEKSKRIQGDLFDRNCERQEDETEPVD